MEFYRYVEEIYFSEDMFKFENSGKSELIVFELVKETKKGYWIREKDYWIREKDCKQKWISKTSLKKFAYQTKEEAVENFYHRKLSHVKHCLENLKKAEAGLTIAKALYYEFKKGSL